LVKQIFLGTTKFGGTKNFGGVSPECPRGYGPAAMLLCGSDSEETNALWVTRLCFSWVVGESAKFGDYFFPYIVLSRGRWSLPVTVISFAKPTRQTCHLIFVGRAIVSLHKFYKYALIVMTRNIVKNSNIFKSFQ